MARYDTQLADERGAVRSGMSPNRNDYRAAADYGRDYPPRETHYWRRPAQLRGEVRGGSAFTYGFGDDYDVAYRRGPGRYDRGIRGQPAGYWGGWLGGEGYPGGRAARRYGHDFRSWHRPGRGGYDRGYREMGWVGRRF